MASFPVNESSLSLYCELHICQVSLAPAFFFVVEFRGIPVPMRTSMFYLSDKFSKTESYLFIPSIFFLHSVMSLVQKIYIYILLSNELLDILDQCYKKQYVVLCSDIEVMTLYFPDLLY